MEPQRLCGRYYNAYHTRTFRVALWIITRIPLIGTIIHAVLHVFGVPHGW